MKVYMYTTNENEKTKIIDFEEENYILLEKDSQPVLCVHKHKIEIIGNGESSVTIKKSKSENYVKAIRKNIIEEGIKNGICEKV